jgi:peptidoglycan/LPS O-acetylase OafA/YrhL
VANPVYFVAAPGRRRDLQSLQILRAVAILAVLLVHLAMLTAHALWLPGYLFIPTFFEASVDLFFVISGFIMVYASAKLFGRPHASISFFAMRVVRIVPLYWAVTGLVLVALLRGQTGLAALDLSWPAIGASFLFVPYARPSGLTWPLLQVGWTLNYEMYFYSVFAVALVLPRRLAIAAISFLFAALVAIRLTGDAWPAWFEFLSRPIVFDFCYGMIIALAFAHGYRLRPVFAVGLIVAACAGLAATGAMDVGNWRTVVWGLPVAAILAAALTFEEKAGTGLLGRAFVLIGNASYSLYLVHLPVMLTASRLLPRLIDPVTWPWLSVALLGALPIAAALVSYFLFERPITHWLQARVRAALPARETVPAAAVGLPAASAAATR